MLKRFLLLTASCCLLAGCLEQPAQVDTTNLNDIERLTVADAPSTAASTIGNIRLQAIKETALSFGAQAGLALRAQQINKVLKSNTYQLDRTFNFRELLLNHNVLPPVLVQGDQLLNLATPDSIRVADKTYKIVAQAHFVTAPPNWRQYLFMNYKKPSVPDKTLLPRTPEEQQVWIKYIRQGWKNGLAQAKTIYLANLSRLERDYKGMVLYRELLAKNMVSKPYVATTALGVTSADHNSQLYINDKVLRITALPHLNPNSNQWRALITHD